MANIAIIDYGMGNLRSVAKALEHVAPKDRVLIARSRAEIASADRIVFPGQGAIQGCIRELKRLELINVIKQAAAEKPFLGLCLGPQALLEYSEENKGTKGLGILPGCVRAFTDHLPVRSANERFKVPHMGWNQVYQTGSHPLWRDIEQNSRFYFVHSYFLEPGIPDMIAGMTHYGFEFTSAIARDNVFAVQFHPEKSARSGLQLLANFTRWCPN